MTNEETQTVIDAISALGYTVGVQHNPNTTNGAKSIQIAGETAIVTDCVVFTATKTSEVSLS